MASAPPQECCITGVIHEGTPRGSFEDIEGFNTYISTPSSKKTDRAILLATDVMGNKVTNPQLIADNLADLGFLVLIPDLFNNDPAPPRDKRPSTWSMDEWRKNHQAEPLIDLLRPWSEKIRSKYSIQKLGVIGYCYGAKVVFGLSALKSSSAKEAFVDAAYMAHPSFTNVDDLKATVVPLSIAAAQTDNLFNDDKRHEAEKILPTLKGIDGQPLHWQINLYSGVNHGFAVRADLKVRIERVQKEGAFRQAAAWFEEYL